MAIKKLAISASMPSNQSPTALSALLIAVQTCARPRSNQFAPSRLSRERARTLRSAMVPYMSRMAMRPINTAGIGASAQGIGGLLSAAQGMYCVKAVDLVFDSTANEVDVVEFGGTHEYRSI